MLPPHSLKPVGCIVCSDGGLLHESGCWSLNGGFRVTEKWKIWIWDPGIGMLCIAWFLFDLVYVVWFRLVWFWVRFVFLCSVYESCCLVASESCFGYPTRLPIGLNKQDKDFGRHFVGEIIFSFKSGFWAIKNLKDAMQSSILLYRPLNLRLEFGCGFQKRVIGSTVLVLFLLFSGLVMFHGLFLFSSMVWVFLCCSWTHFHE